MFFLAATLVGWIGGDFVYRKEKKKKKKKNDTFLAVLASLWNGRDMVVCNSFDIYMFIYYRGQHADVNI